jgi:hypothetical protein
MKSVCLKVTKSETHALKAFDCAIFTILGSRSYADIEYSQENSCPFASSFIEEKFLCSKFLNNSKLNLLQLQGAIFFAIKAASIAIVQDQQKGSTRGYFTFHHERISNAAARFSFNGASQTSFLYHLW